MSNATIEAIERNIKLAKEVAALGNSLERLRTNRDFKTVILDGYFEQEAIRLVHLKADPNMHSAESQLAIVSQMNSIGGLVQYFNTTMHRASLASKNILADQEAIEEIAAEEVANG